MRASVVVITRDRAEIIGRCLDSIECELTDADEVIVVDSSDTDLAQTLITQEYSWVKYIRIPASQGSMPRQRNVGIRHALGGIVAFTDDDCVVHPGWLDHLVNAYSDSEIGGVGGRQVLPQAGVASANQRRAGGWLDYQQFQISGNFETTTSELLETEWLVGCNMSFRRPALIQVGGFDEALAGDFSWEEVDLCTRIARSSWRLVYNAQAVVDHNLASRPRVERGSNTIGYYWRQNRTYFFLKQAGLRIVRRVLLQEPYWSFRSVGWRLTWLYDLRPKLRGCSAFVRFLLRRKKYPLHDIAWN